MENVSIKQLFIFIGVLWALGVFLYFFVFSKKTKAVPKKESNKIYESQDIINYPKPFLINIIVAKEQEISSVLVCDLVIKYSELLNNNYVVPEALNLETSSVEVENNTEESKQENEEIDFTNSNDESEMPDFENFSESVEEEKNLEVSFDDIFNESPVTEKIDIEPTIQQTDLPQTDIHTFDNLNSEF